MSTCVVCGATGRTGSVVTAVLLLCATAVLSGCGKQGTELGGGSSGWQAPDQSKLPRLSLAISPNQRGTEEEQPQTDGWTPISDTPANPPSRMCY